MELAQFGVAIFSMGVLGYVINLFMKFMQKQEDSFTELVKNHLDHNTATLNDLKEILKEIKWILKKNNNSR